MNRFIFAVLLGGAAVQMQAADPLVAVLEHPQCASGNGRSVRVLFAKSGPTRRALDSAETWTGLNVVRREWIVAFDGRDLGQLHTTAPGFRDPETWGFRRDRLLDVRQGDSTPMVANGAKRFEGWCDAPAARPLVLLSGGKSADPWFRSDDRDGYSLYYDDLKHHVDYRWSYH